MSDINADVDIQVKSDVFLEVEFEKQPTIIEMWIGKAMYKKNGKTYLMDASPFIFENRTVVPLRVIAEGLSFKVDWDPNDRKVTVSNGDMSIYLYMKVEKVKDTPMGKVYIGSKYVDIVNDNNVRRIDLSSYNGQNMGVPVIFKGRTYVPVRFISEIFGAKVFWDGRERRVTIIRN
jgi:hypothetical protein